MSITFDAESSTLRNVSICLFVSAHCLYSEIRSHFVDLTVHRSTCSCGKQVNAIYCLYQACFGPAALLNKLNSKNRTVAYKIATLNRLLRFFYMAARLNSVAYKMNNISHSLVQRMINLSKYNGKQSNRQIMIGKNVELECSFTKRAPVYAIAHFSFARHFCAICMYVCVDAGASTL